MGSVTLFSPLSFKERRSEGDRAVGDVLGAPLLLDRATLVGLAMVAIECRGQDFLSRGVRQEVAGKLPGDERVEGEVRIERLDHPVAPGPRGAVNVGLISMGVGISRHVQPVDGHSLAESG